MVDHEICCIPLVAALAEYASIQEFVDARIRSIRNDPLSRLPPDAGAQAQFFQRRDIDVDGVMLAYGGGSAGLSFYLKGGVPRVCYNYFGKMYEIEAKEKLPKGRHTLRFHFDYDGGGLGKGGTMHILVDGKETGKGRIEQTAPVVFSMDTVDVGSDIGRPVAKDCTSARFNGGTMGTVLVELGKQPKATEEHERQKYHVAMARQ